MSDAQRLAARRENMALVRQMDSSARVSALIKLEDTPQQVLALKRLALLFDEIFYLVPDNWPIISETEGKPLAEASFAHKLPDGSLDLSEFRFFRDTRFAMGVGVESLHPELRHTLAVLEQSGIAKQFRDHKQLNSITFKEFETIQNQLAAQDAADEEWNRISATTSADYERNIFETLLYVTVRFAGQSLNPAKPLRPRIGDEFTVACVNPPPAVYYSRRLFQVLTFAHSRALCPVFTDPHSRAALNYRCKQFFQSQSKLSQQFPSLGSALGFPSRFGEVTYSIANSVFDSDLVSGKTPEEIVKYRVALADARRRYLTGDLLEITQLLDCSPWGKQTEDELRRYVTGRLNQDVAKYDEQSQELWEKLFGSIAVRLSEVGTSAVYGGTAGGLIGNIMPHASTWEVAILGALTGAAKVAPKLVETIVESILEARKLKRSSIAYVREFK